MPIKLDYKTPILARVSGKCMLPTLKPDYKILAFPASFQIIKPGDLFLMTDKKPKLICHRLICKIKIFNKFILLHSGDATSRLVRVRQEKVVGKVVRIFDESLNEIKMTRRKISLIKNMRLFIIWGFDSILAKLNKYLNLNYGTKS